VFGILEILSQRHVIRKRTDMHLEILRIHLIRQLDYLPLGTPKFEVTNE